MFINVSKDTNNMNGLGQINFLYNHGWPAWLAFIIVGSLQSYGLTPIYTCIKGTTFLNSTSCMYLHLTHHGHPSQTHPEDLWEHLETQSFPEQEWQSESAVLLWVWSEQPTARKTHCPHLTFHFTVSCCVYNIFHLLIVLTWFIEI